MVESKQKKQETKLKNLQAKIDSCNLDVTLSMYAGPSKLKHIKMHEKRIYQNYKNLLKEDKKGTKDTKSTPVNCVQWNQCPKFAHQ